MTDVGVGGAPFDSTDVATGGVAWNTPGAQGVGTDVVDRVLFDVAIAGEGAEDEGLPYAPIEFGSSGVSVLNDMASGDLANNGFNIFTTDGVADSGNGWRVATRELACWTSARLIQSSPFKSNFSVASVRSNPWSMGPKA